MLIDIALDAVGSDKAPEPEIRGAILACRALPVRVHLIGPEPERAARYRSMSGATHSFLPERNGITPNTLHAVLHGCTAATLSVLAFLTL